MLLRRTTAPCKCSATRRCATSPANWPRPCGTTSGSIGRSARTCAPTCVGAAGREQGDGEAPGRLRNEIPASRATDVAPRANPAANPPQTSATAAPALPEREVPAAEPAALPDPQAVRDSAAAEVEALGPLHDELIEVLEAIQEARTDPWEKRWAGDDVTMARFTKRTQLRDLRPRIAADRPDWSIRGARRSAERARARLQHEIAEARETLAKVRGR